MQSSVALPEKLMEMSPVFVIAPTFRCGTTLVQRLLNSSKEFLIFGEDLVVKNIPSILLWNSIRCGDFSKEAAMKREEFAKGVTEFWSNSLVPDPNMMFQLTLNWFEQVLLFSEKTAKEMKRERFGFKFPLKNFTDFQSLHSFLPKARFIYIYRNVFDVARSAKARKWITTPDQVRNLAISWEKNLLPFLSQQQDRVLMLRYETLVKEQEKEIQRIESFLEMEGIDRSVMERKINTWKGKGEGHSATGYIEPENLADLEEELLLQNTKVGMGMI